MKYVVVGLIAPVLAAASSCRYGPNDEAWPSKCKWDALNATVNSRLIRTVPAGHVCHDPTYNEALCAEVKANWFDPFYKTTLVEAIMTPSFANNSCDPFDKREKPCEIGGYAQYSINVTSPSDVVAGLDFAHRNNIRLVVKNTGHDFLGRSVGYGSLSLWTHNLKKKEFIKNYKSKTYNGPAAKMQAGVQVREANEFVHDHGYMMVGGECPSVGLAGGYTAGGGQSPLSSWAGLSADQTLEFEVITADGRWLRAAPDENHDLYWALSGGGPGYGVVWSVTYRVFPDAPMVGTMLTFDRSNGEGGQDAYWEAVEFWHSMAPAINDFGGYSYTGFNESRFEGTPLFFPNRKRSEVLHFLEPLHKKLESLGVQYDSNTTEFDGYLPAWRTYFNWDEGGVQDSHASSRLIPRKVIKEKSKEFSAVLKKLTGAGAGVQEMTIGARSSIASSTDNAVNPAWREADVFLLLNDMGPDSTGAGVDEKLTHDWMDMLRELAPDSGTYMNEADVYEVDFQKSFYGDNYPRLLAIKDKYDPHGLFYATTGVGSERWQPQTDGRLCRR